MAHLPFKKTKLLEVKNEERIWLIEKESNTKVAASPIENHKITIH